MLHIFRSRVNSELGVVATRILEKDERDGLPPFLAYEAITAVLSDDHCPRAGEAALRALVAHVALVEGSSGLQDLAVDLALKVAELTERIAVAERLAAVDVADILFLD
jgi:hypothetical protein